MTETRTAAIIIPTFNERDSIGRIVEGLCGRVLPTIKNWKVRVIFVDGNSPDGTASAVEAKMAEYPEIDLIVEKEKEGIGAAYFKGFELATEKYKADAVIEFDGDFQHPPELIPLLLERIDEGYDLVLGSRRVRGGSYPKGWGPYRLFLSIFGGIVARFLLFFPTKYFSMITDPTTGLKATSTSGPYLALDFSSFMSRSFGYKIEMLYRLAKQGARISEIPLNFKIRETGESKITSQTPKEIFGIIFKLRFGDPDTIRFLRFAAVGALGFIVNALTLELFSRTGVGIAATGLFRSGGNEVAATSASAALAAECAICSNFLFNNSWTFAERKSDSLPRAILRFISFNATSFGAILIQAAVIGAATFAFGSSTLVRQVSLIVSVACFVVPYNWLMYTKLIWRRKKQA